MQVLFRWTADNPVRPLRNPFQVLVSRHSLSHILLHVKDSVIFGEWHAQGPGPTPFSTHMFADFGEPGMLRNCPVAFAMSQVSTAFSDSYIFGPERVCVQDLRCKQYAGDLLDG